MADLNVDSIANSAGTGAPGFPNGVKANNPRFKLVGDSQYSLIFLDNDIMQEQAYIIAFGSSNPDAGHIAIKNNYSGGDIQFFTDYSEVARFTSTGISFDGGTNSLDDYEEDVWTPGIQLGTATGHTYSVRTGTYTKIGRTVTASFTIQMTAKDAASSNDMYITGLPFSAINVSFGANWAQQFGITVGSPYTSYIGHSSGTSIRLLRVSNGSYDIIQNSEVGSNVTLKGSMNFDV